jgi:voltage-gated potassium channel
MCSVAHASDMESEYLGGRAAVLLTLLVGVLSIATGVANIGTPLAAFGPFARFLPAAVRTTAGFTGTLTGFLVLAAALGLRRGYRLAWYATVVLLPVTAAQGLVQSSGYSLPLVVLSLLALPVVALERRRFDRDLDLTTTQTAALVALVGSQIYVSIGAFALREQFGGIQTLTDAVYFALVTSSTVGYGDVTPQTGEARLFGLSALLVGTASFAVALGVLLTPAIEARLTKALGRMTTSDLELLDDHVLVLGYGELTEPLLSELGDRRYLVVTDDGERARELSGRDVQVYTGDPSDEATLSRVHLDDARAVIVATNDDADDALTILTVRHLRPDVRIVAAATQRENETKLERAGADAVVSPASIGGRLLVESALDRRDVTAAEDRLFED